MFGLPTAVISVVCYSLCCMETIDDEVQSDEDSDDEVETTAQLIGLYDSVMSLCLLEILEVYWYSSGDNCSINRFV